MIQRLGGPFPVERVTGGPHIGHLSVITCRWFAPKALFPFIAARLLVRHNITRMEGPQRHINARHIPSLVYNKF
jgi:hypothetical protein